MMQPNKTKWVDTNIEKFAESLAEVAPDDTWLPVPDPDGAGVAELGCGHYGCVMPTEREDTVFKLTTDPAEAAFVRVAIHLSEKHDWPAGMIVYKAIYQLAKARYRKRPIFALWRQEAYDVGSVLGGANWMREELSPYDRIVRNKAIALLENAKYGAAAFRDRYLKHRDMEAICKFESMAWDVVGENYDMLGRSPYGGTWLAGRQLTSTSEVMKRYRGDQRAAIGLRVYEAAIEMMEHDNPLLTNVGAAMGFYREVDIVLADVHAGNIGRASHPDYDDRTVVITDPGHAVFLTDRYDGLKIEELTP